MDKETASATEFDAQPPPYSELAPSHSIPSVQPITIPLHAPHPHYQSQHQGHLGSESVIQTHVITQQPGSSSHIVTTSPLFGPEPRMMICTVCNQTVTSKVSRQHSRRTHLCALCLALFCCWPCVLCIYCRKCSLHSNHYCPNCNSYQGSYIPDYQ